MAEIDKVKEQVGWMKVVFALLIAIDVSLVAWIVQNITTSISILVFLAIALLIFVTLAAMIVNHSAKKMIDRLGDL